MERKPAVGFEFINIPNNFDFMDTRNFKTSSVYFSNVFSVIFLYSDCWFVCFL